MNRELYVTNLSPTTYPRELQALFSQAGQVAALTVIRDGLAGRERSVACVEMESQEGAQAAMARFNQYSLGGLTLTVRERGAAGSPIRTRRRPFRPGDSPSGAMSMLDEGGPLRQGD